MFNSCILMSEILKPPSMKVPFLLMLKVFRRPYWLQIFGHQCGVNRPGLDPKSPGLIQYPRLMLFIEKCISDG